MSQSQQTQQSQDDVAAAFDSFQYPDYDKDKATFEKFLQEHTILVRAAEYNDDDLMLEPTADDSQHGALRRQPCYLELLQRIRDRRFYDDENQRTFLVQVPLEELVDWNQSLGGDLAERASNNAVRYAQLFCSVLDEAIERLEPSTEADSTTEGNSLQNRDEILHQQRREAQQRAQQQRENQDPTADDDVHNRYAGNLVQDNENNENVAAANGAVDGFPPLLMRRFELRLLPRGRRGDLPPFVNQVVASKSSNEQSEASSLRQIRSRCVGQLVTVTGMVVRASHVKPLLQVATYACNACGAEVYAEVTSREFLPRRACPSPTCSQTTKKLADTLHLETRLCKFTKFQEIKLQELPSQVPFGHVPRSLTVSCRGELTRLASPGNIVTIDGVFLPRRIAESGYRAMKAGLVATTYLQAQHIQVHQKSFDESILSSPEEVAQVSAEISQIASGPDPIGKLASSIAPEIFGHEDIKRSLLLQLVSGCSRQLPDGMRIRGDINILLMGDPGVAKSQLLKHVASIAPRGVYTTGKGSSGVGLTAAVTKDLTSGELALEGGALVLADRGICCIDEFDKMDEADRTAIHEVMEQQTVSIAKAGIVAQLNARAAVLAAANPVYGRYNPHRSLSENVNLPNSLLSRFDLLFLVLDVPVFDRDMELARHVTLVHQREGRKGKEEEEDEEMETEHGEGDKQVVSPKVLREYIARARQHAPVMPPQVAPYVVEAYVSLRRNQQVDTSDQASMTPRQLLSILRLSQALARLRFSDFVAREDVDEAIRLTHQSKASLTEEQENGAKKKKRDDTLGRIYRILKDYANSRGRDNAVDVQTAQAMVLRKGFTAQQLQACLQEYEQLEIWALNHDRTQIHWRN